MDALEMSVATSAVYFQQNDSSGSIARLACCRVPVHIRHSPRATISMRYSGTAVYSVCSYMSHYAGFDSTFAVTT